MPKSLQAALLPLLIAVLSALATKLGIDARDSQGSILAVAASLAALLATGYGWLTHAMDARKVRKAETILPGITKVPKGMETQATLTVNDPTTPDPPTEIAKETKSTP